MRAIVRSAGVVLALAAAAAVAAAEKPARPNILWLVAEDLGPHLGCYGTNEVWTPNLDRLAAEGVRYANAFTTAPVCSPFRAALMTGQYPVRTGITDYLRPNDPKHLAMDYETLPELLKKAGYVTGIIGKWHLTGYANHGAEETPPSRHGFNEVIVSENRGIADGSYFFPYHFSREIQQRVPGREYLVDRCNLEAVEFIERHKDTPFFLYLSHYAVHTKLAGKPELVTKYEAKPGAGRGAQAPRNNPHLAAQLECIDQGVGMIWDRLRALGLSEDTILIFTGDNGGEGRVTSNAPWRAGKSTLYEGGIREPLIIHWPGVTKPGSICPTPVCTMDFYPTLAEAARCTLPRTQTTDGLSLVPILKDPRAALHRDAFYWHYPLEKSHFLGGRSVGAIRKGEWKLLEFFDTGERELYNLAEDPGEQRNLAGQRTDKEKELVNALHVWQKQVGARFPQGQPKTHEQ